MHSNAQGLSWGSWDITPAALSVRIVMLTNKTIWKQYEIIFSAVLVESCAAFWNHWKKSILYFSYFCYIVLHRMSEEIHKYGRILL